MGQLGAGGGEWVAWGEKVWTDEFKFGLLGS